MYFSDFLLPISSNRISSQSLLLLLFFTDQCCAVFCFFLFLFVNDFTFISDIFSTPAKGFLLY